MSQDPHMGHLISLSRVATACRWIAWTLPFSATAVSLINSQNPLASLVIAMPGRERHFFNEIVLPFFAAVIMSLLIAMWQRPQRRLPLMQLTVGLTLWAASTVISQRVDGTPQPLHFPSAADGVVLAGAVCLAGFIILDRRGPRTAPAIVWLNTAVIAGSLIATLSAASLLGPVEQALARTPASVFIDLALASVVISQCRSHRRQWRWSGLLLLIALALMAGADLAQRAIILDGRIDYPLILDVAWALAVLLLTGVALNNEPLPKERPSPRMAEGLATLGGLMTATLVLALAPPGPVRSVVIAPALLAVAAAAARAVIALRSVQNAAESVRKSLTDDLTGMPNRRAVEAYLAESAPSDQACAVAVLDLRGFKDLNDTLGHVAGDAFLQVIGTRLRDVAPEHCLVARLAADEFCVAFPTDSESATLALTEDLLATLSDSVTIEGLTLTPDWSVGMAMAPRRTLDLLRHADIAVFHAKRTGRVTMFDPTLDTYSRARLELGEELRRALVSDQLELWFQPQLNLQIDQVDGVEALVRWRHPTRGLIPPGEFLEAGRRLGLMPAITEIIVRLACRQAAQWRREGLSPRMSVNMGADELLSPPLICLLLDQIKAEGLPEHSITIEVTEESFLADRTLAQTTIKRLVAAGVDVSVDDYGTGFSSLTYLRHLPLRELKIDQSFVMQVCEDARSRTIVAATAALAHALDMRVVAEGVENEDVLKVLRDLPIDHAQGYHIAHPMPAAEATQWLRLNMVRNNRLPIPPQPTHRHPAAEPSGRRPGTGGEVAELRGEKSPAEQPG